MKKILLIVFTITFFVLNSSLLYAKEQNKLTNIEIANILIKESISNYHGNCPCPYNLAKNGSSCGKRSAYSRPGGASPLCFKEDVSKGMIDDWRRKHEGE